MAMAAAALACVAPLANLALMLVASQTAQVSSVVETQKLRTAFAVWYSTASLSDGMLAGTKS